MEREAFYNTQWRSRFYSWQEVDYRSKADDKFLLPSKQLATPPEGND
jgi:hypothetical protein